MRSLFAAGRGPTGIPGRLKLQRALGRLVFPILYCAVAFGLRCIMAYRVDPEDRRRIRREFRTIAKRPGPVLVCANHLTMIDSVIMLWAFAGPLDYTLRFARLCWNVPAVENFAHSFWQRLITYLAKCLPIDRQGDREHIDGVFEQLRLLIAAGEYVMLFPEGTRSRTGRFQAENITYGAGRLVQSASDCRVLCVYLRGANQRGHSNLPRRGEVFRIFARSLPARALRSDLAGLRGAREISRGIAAEIADLENEYFATPEGARMKAVEVKAGEGDAA
ncbi:MAG: lysophospholipid acyltransferase family protein [Leptospirales bacterium]|jgi:1-acyl-sn-glycerol-3-phosphate acyltransferase